jgi:hypothetical protein
MIKNHNNFIKDIFESYDNPSDILWTDLDDKLIGHFLVNNIKYKIECICRDNNIWTYKFLKFDKDSNSYIMELSETDPISKMCILGTIRIGMDYLIVNKNPNGLIYAALDDSDGRKKLYTRFSNEIVKEYKYEFKANLQDNKEVYFLYKNIKLGLLIDVVGKIIDDI